MKMTEHKLIAYTLGKDGTCTSIAYCRTCSDKEVNKMLNELAINNEKKANEEKEKEEYINSLSNAIEELKHEIKVLKGEE